jgi:hypothetical protein
VLREGREAKGVNFSQAHFTFAAAVPRLAQELVERADVAGRHAFAERPPDDPLAGEPEDFAETAIAKEDILPVLLMGV